MPTCCDCAARCADDARCFRCARPTCDRCQICGGGVWLCRECYEETVDAK